MAHFQAVTLVKVIQLSNSEGYYFWFIHNHPAACPTTRDAPAVRTSSKVATTILSFPILDAVSSLEDFSSFQSFHA